MFHTSIIHLHLNPPETVFLPLFPLESSDTSGLNPHNGKSGRSCPCSVAAQKNLWKVNGRKLLEKEQPLHVTAVNSSIRATSGNSEKCMLWTMCEWYENYIDDCLGTQETPKKASPEKKHGSQETGLDGTWSEELAPNALTWTQKTRSSTNQCTELLFKSHLKQHQKHIKFKYKNQRWIQKWAEFVPQNVPNTQCMLGVTYRY